MYWWHKRYNELPYDGLKFIKTNFLDTIQIFRINDFTRLGEDNIPTFLIPDTSIALSTHFSFASVQQTLSVLKRLLDAALFNTSNNCRSLVTEHFRFVFGLFDTIML